MKLLLIEDLIRLRRTLGLGLGHEGFSVDLAADGVQGYQLIRSYDYDVIVLDIMMPRLNGLELLCRLRGEGFMAAVLILSAKGQVEDRVKGLENGADDYLIKPFAFEELCARIRTLGRRHHSLRNPRIELGKLELDTAKRQVKTIQGPLNLTPSEYKLLECLALRRRRVVSKNGLRDLLYDCEDDTESNVIEVLVSTLRKKLRAARRE